MNVRIRDFYMLLRDIRDFIFPRQCITCGNRLRIEEECICASCYTNLPFTNYHLSKHNELEKMFWNTFPMQRATSLLYYDEEYTRRIIHVLKYDKRPKVGFHLAQIYANELKYLGFFEGIDCIIPVPLHWKRQMRRGYNQSKYIADGISKVCGIKVYHDVIKRSVNNPSQTRLNHAQREENVNGIFQLKKAHKIQGKHILLVDDVTTTGATIASCSKELAKAGHVKISILTLAIAKNPPIQPFDNDKSDVKMSEWHSLN